MAEINSAYSFNMAKGDGAFLLDPRFDHSPLVSAGVGLEYRPIRRASIKSGLLVGNEWLSYSYRDWDAFMEPNVNGSDYLNQRIYNSPSLVFIGIPLDVNVFLTPKFHLTGGLLFRYQFNSFIARKIESYSTLGFGWKGQKLGFRVIVNGNLNMRECIVASNKFNEEYPGFNMGLSSRSINLSLTYNLWSNK